MLKNILLIFSTDIFSKALSMLVVLILAKIFSVEEFGKYNYIITVLSLFAIVIQPYASTYIRDFRAFDHKQYDISFNIISVLIFIPMSIILYNILEEVSILLIIVFYLYQLLSINLQSYFNIHEMYKKYSFINVFQQIIALLVVFSFFSFSSKENIDVELFIGIIYGLITIILFIYAFKYMHNIKIKKDFKRLFKFFKDSSYLIGYWSILPLVAFFDMYYIDNYLTDYALGLYSFSMKIFAIALVGLSPILTVLRVKQIDIVKEGTIIVFIKKNIVKVLAISVVFYMIMIVVTFVLSKYIFIEYEKSFIPSIILITTAFISYATIPFGFLMAGRKYKQVFIIGTIGVILNIIIKELYIIDFGLNAVAVSSFACHSFINISFFLFSLFYFKESSVKVCENENI